MKLSTRARTLVCAGLVALGASCTLINEAPATQCRSEEDCRSRGPEWADTTCSAARVCVKVEAQQALCSTSQECSDRNGGGAYRCQPTTRQCVPITTADCPKVFGEKQDYLNDNAIFLGLSYANDAVGTFMEAGAEIARSQLRLSLGGGLPPAQVGGPVRPLVILGCPNNPIQNFGSITSLVNGTNHLIKDLDIPANIGPLTAKSIAATIQPILIPNNVSTFLVGGAAIDVVPQDKSRFLIGPFIEPLTAIVPSLMTEILEPRVRADGIAAPGEPIRVQVISAEDQTGRFITNYFLNDLKFNSPPASPLEPANAENFRYSSLGDTQDPVQTPDVEARQTAAIATAISFKPHVIIITADTTRVGIMPAIEMLWPDATPRPLFVSTLSAWAAVSINAINTLPPAMRDPLRKRYMGVSYLSPNENAQQLLQFNVERGLKFSQVPPVTGDNPAITVYDSVFTIAYAIAAAGASEIKGDVIARNIARLTSGERVQTGTADAPRAISTLLKGGSIQLSTVNGDLKFDDKNSFQHWNASVFCLSKAPDGISVAPGPVRSGYEYDPIAKRSTGAASFQCP